MGLCWGLLQVGVGVGVVGDDIGSVGHPQRWRWRWCCEVGLLGLCLLERWDLGCWCTGLDDVGEELGDLAELVCVAVGYGGDRCWASWFGKCMTDVIETCKDEIVGAGDGELDLGWKPGEHVAHPL